MKEFSIVHRRLLTAGFSGSGQALFVIVAVLVNGCGHKQDAQPFENTPEVTVETLTAQAIPMTTDLPGRIDPERIAQVRARVDGIVLHREFQQGSNVQSGEVLYQIDPAPYRAVLDSATANVAQSEASLTQAQLLADRYKPLVSINAVSKQNYDNAVSAAAQAKAGLAAAQAAQETAQINFNYCTVTAPIAGRIGPALVTEGALVSQAAATEMAVIQQMDPIYFDFTESSADALKLRREAESGQLTVLPTGETKLTLTLPDGTTYPHPGKLIFADVSVDPTSGMITLRAEFPNPDNWLLPGMFAVGRLEQAVAPQAILVSQPAVTIGANGSASVMVVNATNEVRSQVVTLGPAVGTKWVITEGLKSGDRVIVEGLQKVQPGMKVKPVAVKPDDQNAAPPAAGR